MYLLALTFGLGISYFLLLFLFSFFFENKKPRITKKSFYFVSLLCFLSFVGYNIAFSIHNPALSNRFLHAFGGGFLAFLTCFLAVKENGLSIGKFCFFIFSALIVTAMGVANEIIEYFFQNYTDLGLIFAVSINDTWLDLLSNTVGMLIASICFVPFVHEKIVVWKK